MLRDDAQLSLPDWEKLTPPTAANLRILATLEGASPAVSCSGGQVGGNGRDITVLCQSDQNHCDDNEWKKRFDLLTEIQRGCKHANEWMCTSLQDHGGTQTTNTYTCRRSMFIERSVELATNCLVSLRSVLARNAMLTIEALMRSMMKSELEAVLLQNQPPPKGSRVPLTQSVLAQTPLASSDTKTFTPCYSARFEKLVMGLHQRASSTAEKKFITSAAVVTLRQISAASEAFAEAVLTVLAKNISSVRGSNGIVCSGKIAQYTLGAIDKENELTPNYLRRIIPSVSQIALYCLNDKMSESRTLGRDLLSISVQLCSKESKLDRPLIPWLRNHWQLIIDRLGNNSQRSTFQKETNLIINSSPIFQNIIPKLQRDIQPKPIPPNSELGGPIRRQTSRSISSVSTSTMRSSSLRAASHSRLGNFSPSNSRNGRILGSKPPALPVGRLGRAPIPARGIDLKASKQPLQTSDERKQDGSGRFLASSGRLVCPSKESMVVDHSRMRLLTGGRKMCDTAPLPATELNNPTVLLNQKLHHRRATSLCNHKHNPIKLTSNLDNIFFLTEVRYAPVAMCITSSLTPPMEIRGR